MSATIRNIKINDTMVPIIFEKHSSLPIFNLQLIFKNSGFIVDKNQSGLTSLSAKLLNEGTKKDGVIKFARNLENKAISIHTSNGFETFVIEVSCLKSEMKTALKFLDQLLNDPNFSNKTLDKLKTLQISKLKQKENDFDYVAHIQLNKLIFNGTALEHSPLGDIKSIKNIQLKDIKTNIKNIFNLDNLIVVAGGDISFKELKLSIKPIIKNFKPYGSATIKNIKASSSVKNKIIYKKTQQAYVYFGSPFNIDSNDKNIYKAKVASFILGGSGFGSRLMEEIRVKRGLAYSAYGDILSSKSNSIFTGYLQTKIKNQKEAQELVVTLINEFIKNGVTQKELNSAKKFLLGSEPLRTETFAQRQNRAFYLYYKGLKQSYPADELKLIEDLELKDLNNFIKSHKEMKNLSFAIVTQK
ncbi:Zinc protease-like protein [hydrothermal vent metagenome]|uniref:Zinc protease-like protein n=1 Tax=hydrothermal vent metagenome TaxID=652676 RepID=A0A3B1E4Z7_9ZZZZ